MFVSELGRVALVELPLVVESKFVGATNIANEVMRVLFVSLDFNYNISQVLDFSLGLEYINESHAGTVTTCISGVTISRSVSPIGCRADEVRTTVKTPSVRA